MTFKLTILIYAIVICVLHFSQFWIININYDGQYLMPLREASGLQYEILKIDGASITIGEINAEGKVAVEIKGVDNPSFLDKRITKVIIGSIAVVALLLPLVLLYRQIKPKK